MGQGGETGFRGAFDRLYPQARALAERITRDPAVSEELAAEALMRLYVRWVWLSRRSYVDAWTLRVTTNLALDVLRRRRPSDVAGPAALDPVAIIADRLDLARAMRRLPRRQREVVALRYLGDLSEAEVARMLGITGGSVKTHLRRGLAGLRGLLSPPDDLEVGHADG